MQKTKWKIGIKGAREVSQRTPVIFSNRALLTFNYGGGCNFQGVILCVDIETGSEIWRFEIDHFLNEPVVDEVNSIYITCFNGSTYKLDSLGNVLWKTSPTNSNTWKPILCGDLLVYAEIAGGANRTWGLSRKDGSIVWANENGGHSYSLATNSKRVVHSTVKGSFENTRISLTCIDAINAKLIWKVAHQKYLFRPTILDGKIFIGSRGCVLCFCIETGDILAKHEIAEDVAVTQPPIVTSNGVVFITEEGTIISLTLLSQKQSFFKKPVFEFHVNWITDIGSQVEAEAVLDGNNIHILCESGSIATVSTDTGILVSKTMIPEFSKGFGISIIEKDFLVAASRKCIRIASN